MVGPEFCIANKLLVMKMLRVLGPQFELPGLRRFT